MQEKKGGYVPVKEKTTGDLSQELMNKPDLDSYLRENQEYFFHEDMTELLAGIFEKKGISKAALARAMARLKTRRE